MKVKICGITNLDDALCAVQNGCDAIGFVFHQSSPRYIEPLKAKEIIKKLPVWLQKVGLFTTHSVDEINDIATTCKLSLVQMHTHCEANLLEQVYSPIMQTIRVKSKDDLSNLEDKYYLVDAYVEEFGGQGVRINTSYFEGINCSKLILAGGLDAQNVAQIAQYGFYGVDVSSGVEKSRGVKSQEKIKKFIEVAKSLSQANA